MIPTEVAAIATLIWPDWQDLLQSEDCEDRAAGSDILEGAHRIYNAGYRQPDGNRGVGS